MKRLGLAFALAFLWFGVAQAQIGVAFPGPGTAHSAGGGAPTFVPGAAVAIQNTGFSGPYNATNLNGGTPYPTGAVIVIGIADPSGCASTTTTLTVGGSLVLTKLATAGSNRLFVFYGQTTGSTTDSIAFVPSGGCGNFGVISGYMTGVQPTPSASSSENPELGSSNQPNAAITVASPGIGVVVFMGNNSGTFITPTFTSVTNTGGDTNTTSLGGTSIQLGIAHTITGGSWQPSVSPFAFNTAVISTAWGP